MQRPHLRIKKDGFRRTSNKAPLSLNPPPSTLAAGGGVGSGLVVTPVQAPQQQADFLQKSVAEEYRWCLLPCGQPNIVMHGRPWV